MSEVAENLEKLTPELTPEPTPAGNASDPLPEQEAFLSKQEVEANPDVTVLPDDGLPPKNLWISNQETPVTVYAYKSRFDGSLMAVLQKSNDLLTPIAVCYPVTSMWTIPSYKRLSFYRRQSSVWVPEAEGHVIDRITLRRWLLLYHLRSIDLVDPVTQEPLALSHRKDRNGVERLTPESEEKLNGIHPQIMDTMIEKFKYVSSLSV